jgi:hypothetical protein
MTFEPLERRTLLAVDVVINEIMTDNNNAWVDQDGEASDWLELYNRGDTAADLTGYYLTDDPALLNKWQFPATNLAVGGYMVVFASNKNRTTAGQELHTNFALSADGEYLALVAPDGQTIVSAFDPGFPALREDVSYGLSQEQDTLVPRNTDVRYHVPVAGDAPLGTGWTASNYNDASWSGGPGTKTGLGYNTNPSGFDVTLYLSTVIVDNLTTAEAVIADPSLQFAVFNENVGTFNYQNTGDGGHMEDDRSFPGLAAGEDVEDFVVLATASVVIPNAGNWTFGVNSDDGFGLSLSGPGGNFQMSYADPRGPGDTFGVFNVTQPGTYQLRLSYYERGGGSEVELFAAEGSYDVFDANAFRLVGDAVGGGLAVTGFGGAIQTDVGAQMRGNNSSLWSRIEFDVADPSEITGLLLRMQYNDGFVAFLNGQKIASGNAPATIAWDSPATKNRTVAQSNTVEEFNVSQFASLLVPGKNVLAIQGMARLTTDADFLMLPELLGSSDKLQLRYFSPSTPGQPNSTGVANFVGDTNFSIDHGFYDAPITVAITSETPDATIRYTLNGSEPSATSGILYTGPIVVSQTTVLRAVAFKEDWFPSNVDTQTYLFVADVVQQSRQSAIAAGFPSTNVNGQYMDYGMDPDIVNSPVWGPQLQEALKSIGTMSIVTDVNNLFNPSTGIYVNANRDGRTWEREASFELINPDGSDGFQVEAGLRIRGGYSRSGGNPKHAFRLFFRGEYGDSKLEYPLFGSEGVSEFDKIDLRTSQNYSWSFGGDSQNLMIRDIFSRDVQGALGQPYTKGRFYHLYLNGVYWGIFQTEERPEANFGESYLGGDADNFDTVKVEAGPYTIEATDGNLDAWRDLWQQAGAGLASTASYNRIQGLNPDGSRNPNYSVLVDVDNVIDYMLVILYGGNLDAPISNFLGNTAPNNWYGIRDRTGDTGFQFISHDAEHTLLMGQLGVDRNGPWSAGDGFAQSNPQWLHQQLMENPEYRLRFADEVQATFFNGGVFTPEKVRERLQKRADEIQLAIIAESARWGDSQTGTPLTKNDWQNELNRILNNYVPQRTNIVLNQFRNTRLRDGTLAPLYPNIDAPIMNQHGGQITAGFPLLISAPLGQILYTTDGTDPRLPNGAVSPAAKVFESTTTTSTFIAPGAVWRYLDNGSNQGAGWRTMSYDDSTWKTGPAQLGYGDGDEATLVSFGPSASNKYITTYFRQEFDVADPTAFTSLLLRLVRDDGGVVYLNGQEIARSNMPDGAINYQTPALSSVGGTDEVVFNEFNIPTSRLRAGRNVIAVEVHQNAGNSSDMSFDLSLVGQKTIGTPLPLNAATQVKTRAKDTNNNWSALSAAQFFLNQTAGPGDLAITEINYNPYDPTAAEIAAGFSEVDDFEFIEIRNVGDEAVDLTGVKLAVGITFDFTGAQVTTLEPGAYVVVARNLAAFQARYGAGRPVAGVFTGALSNGGEILRLESATAEVIQEFTYDDAGDWPGRPDGGGSSLEVISVSGDYNDGNNWRPSVEYGGTPGGPSAGPLASVIVNEVLTHTDLPDVDAIELFNPTAQPIDIGGWYLTDSSDEARKFKIPAGTIIPAGGYLVFDEGDFNPTPQNPAPNHFGLNAAEGDDVYIIAADAAGNPTRFIDHVEFGAIKNGETWGRWPNATGDMAPMVTRTLGSANSGPRVGPVVISEIMYNPPAAGGLQPADLEYVEIYNPTDSEVDLSHWTIGAGVDYAFPLGTKLPAGQTLVIVRFDPTLPENATLLTGFRTAYGIDANVRLVGGFLGALDNGGETLRLFRPDEPPEDEPGFYPQLPEDKAAYDDTAPWPTTPDGGGQSLTRYSPQLWGDDADSWVAAAPSPGRFTVPVVADANRDGKVDLNDFGLLKADFGKMGTGLRVDFNVDYRVDLSDFGMLKANFGHTAALIVSAVAPPSVARAAVQGASVQEAQSVVWQSADFVEGELGESASPASLLFSAAPVARTATEARFAEDDDTLTALAIAAQGNSRDEALLDWLSEFDSE